MKRIAGPLRVELAQYRELAAFSQFGSDLSKDTLDRLRHGERIVEILKQPQYSPMPVEQQILILYMLTNKYFSKVYVEHTRKCQDDFLEFIDSKHSYISDEIRKTGDISADIEVKVKAAIEEFFSQQQD
jgi:F-type H+-transporting ATPase subunit alpha